MDELAYSGGLVLESLKEEEKVILIRIRNKQLLYILGSYFTLVTVLVNAWGNDWIDIILRRPVDIHRWGPFGPYFIGAFFLGLTIFFTVYYFEAVHPYTKDIRRQNIEVVFTTTGVYKTPFFEDYYLETAIRKRKLIKINRELYEAFLRCGKARIRVSPYARFIFSIECGDSIKKFNEKNTVIEE